MSNTKVDEALKNLNKRYETQAVKLSGNGGVKIEAVSTGCYSLDWLFGCGGLPRGRIIEVHGEESSGKSTLAAFFASKVQQAGGKVVWIDAEFSFDEEHAKELGMDVKKLLLLQPVTAEEALDAVNELAKTNSFDLIVLDSVAALVPRRESEEEIGKEDMALQARIMSKALRVLGGNLSRSKTAAVFINQMREKVGVYWGTKKTTPGGKALRFWASVRLEVKKGESFKDKDNDVIGNRLKICAVKNKVGNPFRETEVDLYYKDGVDVNADLIDFGVKQKVIKLSGASYSFGDEKLGQGKAKAIEYLSKTKGTRDKIIAEITKKEDVDLANESQKDEK